MQTGPDSRDTRPECELFSAIFLPFARLVGRNRARLQRTWVISNEANNWLDRRPISQIDRQ